MTRTSMIPQQTDILLSIPLPGFVSLIEETIREKLYRCLHNEVPYQVEQMNRSLDILPPKVFRTYMKKKNQPSIQLMINKNK